MLAIQLWCLFLQLSWSEFGAGLDRLIESTHKERDVLLQRTTLPEWVTISRKVRKQNLRATTNNKLSSNVDCAALS
jgi:hypothetical protein